MSILDLLSREDIWQEFLDHKKQNEFFPKREAKELESFIEKKGYLPVCQAIMEGKALPPCTLHKINKKNSEKKRTVFVFPYAENYVLKLLAYLLYKYDYLFENNLYSFRQKISVKQGVVSLIKEIGNEKTYSYKADIHDYFNSVDTEKMVEILKNTITDDKPLLDLIISIITNPYAKDRGKLVVTKKGIMAGVPISGFLADLYLSSLDRWFSQKGILYARYSDDIITFAKTKEEIEEYEKHIKDHLLEMGLELNPKKEIRTSPGESWEFLGFLVDGKKVDICNSSVKKMKDKMKRKARALIRWRKRNKKEPRFAVRAFIKHFNKKMYETDQVGELNWCKWYFPTINVDTSIHALDLYAVECMRYIYTGKHNKSNYNLRYAEIKELGFRSLVNEFYKFKNEQ